METLAMSKKERRRLELFNRVREGEASFETLRRYVERYGLPRSVYADRASIYRTTRDATADENLADKLPETQFGRAMQELDVELILAHSPQAKGRVERRNAVFQDRLVKALRLKGIDDLEDANAFLEQEFLTDMNEKFNVSPREQSDLHRRVPRGVNLERVLSFQEARIVQNDWTIRWRNRWFQLTQENRKLALVKRTLTVCELLDGTVLLLLGKRVLAWEELPERPQGIAKVKPVDKPKSKVGRESETVRVASVATGVQVPHGEQRGHGVTTNQGVQKDMTRGDLPGGMTTARRGWGLLRYVGLTPSSATQAPPPAKGTFLFGERRGHFYRWTTLSVNKVASAG